MRVAKDGGGTRDLPRTNGLHAKLTLGSLLRIAPG